MIDILRKINGVETVVVSVSNKNASHKQVIMGADEVSVGIVVSQFIDVKDGDYINHNGIVYTCNRDAEYTKSSDISYQYNLLFEHPFYRLLDKLFTYPLTGSAVFTLTGKLVDFVDAVCWNMNYHATNNPRGIDSGWTRGSVVDTDYLTLTFGSISCRDAITQIATAFNAEFFFSGSGKTINFVDHIENETGLVFIQGRGNGLYSVSQQNVDTKDTITRVYPVGGNQNVPNAYADEDGNLKLPELYLQNTSEYSRIVEKRVVFEDVFPHFVGDVESVAGTNNVELVCSDIDFDLNEIAVGSNARINFLTGSLMGISFQFQFDFATKKVTLIPQNDDTALVNDDGTTPQVPQALKKAVIGDKFNFTGVVMPVQYVNAAITKLREKGTSWLSFYSRKRVKFGLDIDYRWMRDKQALSPGDLVTIQIPERGVDKTIRISEINTNLYDGQLNATVSNYRDENWQKKVEGAISSLQTTVSGGGSGSGGVDILERYDERPASDRNVMSSMRSEKNFLRKDMADTAAERVTFDKGAVVRDLATKDFVQDKFAGSGAGIYEDSQGNSVIEVDKLNVRKEAWFNEIVINQIRFQGGIVVYSAATLEVLSVADGGSYLQVYFDTKDGQLSNQFAVDDQIRCQRFSGGNVIKYYMSRVTSVGADYIRLSKSDVDGTLNVEVGDAIVQFGNRTNTARQSLIEVNVLDGGKQTFYQGVNSYTLTNKNYLELGRILVDGQWKNMIRSYGGAYLGNRDLSSYIQYNETTGKVEIKADVQFRAADNSYKSVEQAIDEVTTENTNYVNAVKADLQSQIDGNITSFFYDYEPTLANIPASSWTPDSVRDIHLGDLFYWTSKGYAYRFQKVAGIYSWTKISDTDVTKALADAAKAQDTADGKRRVFVSQPTPPYDLGDLWSQGTGGDLMKCKTAKTIAQSYSASDWEKSSKYTDDTAVNNMKIGGVNLILKSDFAKSLDGIIAYSGNSKELDSASRCIIIGSSPRAHIPNISLKANVQYIFQIERWWDDIEQVVWRGNTFTYTLFTEIYREDVGFEGGQRIFYSIKLSGADSGYIQLENTTALGEMRLRYPQLEEATKPSRWSEAPQDIQQQINTIDAQSRSLDFMKSAVENGSTEFQGGLGLINLLFQKTLAGIVNGGMSGLEGDNILNWGGSTYQQAIADAAKAFGSVMSSAFLNKEDGGGHLAFGKIAWDLLGKLMVGDFEIKSGAIIGKDSTFAEKIKIHTGNLKTIAELSNSWNRDASIYSWSEFNSGVDDWSNSFNSPVQISKVYYVAGTFSTVENNTQVRLSAGTHNAVMNNATLNSKSILFKISKDGTVIATNSGNLSEIQIATAGNYNVSMLITITATIPANTGNASCDIDTIVPGYVEVQQAVARTEIAANGFMSYWSNLLYFYFSQATGITYKGAIDAPAGLGGASITAGGSVFANWGKIALTSQIAKSGSNYTITHNIGDTNYSLILTPISTNIPYYSSKSANTVVVTCSGGFDFILVRTQ